MKPQRPWPDSLWAATAPDGPELSPLDGDIQVDTVIIGAGFTGLSTALHLASAGIDVAVVEAVEPGWGASGRNNGQVIPNLTRAEPDSIVAQHGDAGERFVTLLRDSAKILFDLVREHDIAAEAEQTGWMQPVHTPGRMKIAQQRFEQWSKWGAPVEVLSREDVQDMTGSDFWFGGLLNPTGGHINPLALARGLATAVVKQGGRIFTHTPATAYSHQGGQWRVETERGTVTADKLMLATNAYTGELAAGLAPQISRQVIPVLSWQMATRPLSDNIRRRILPGRQALSDTQGDLHFARYDARHRLVTGGALLIPVKAEERMRQRIGARLQRMFPDIGEVVFDYIWNGYVGMTTDFMPRFHQLGPNGLAWVGCNGRGVALSVALGGEFARALQGDPIDELALPLSAPKPLPGHGLLRRVARLRLLQYRWKDAREV